MPTPIFPKPILYIRKALLCSTLLMGCGMLNAAFATERPKPAPLPWMMAAAYPAESVRSPAGITAIAATQPDRLHSVMMQDPDAARTSAFELPAWNIPALVSSLNPAAPRARAPETDLYPLASIEPALPLATPALSRLLQQIEQPEAMSAGPEVHPPAQADTATSQPPVSPQLKQAVEDWQARPAARSDERKLRAAIVSFYTARNFAPLWSHNGQWSAQAHAALGRVERAGEDGLDLGTMPRPDLGPDAANLAENELMLTDLVAHYAAQAMGSRIDPLEISKLITAKPTEPDFADILNHVAAAEDAGSLLQGVNPPQKGYADLRNKLAELRREARPMVQTPIPTGPVLKVGMKDPRVPLIRERFGLSIEPNIAGQDIVYDTRVAAAVADFQSSNGLPPSGTLTPRTIAALSGGEPERLESELIANMEIWRWVPRDMGHDRIEVNLTEFAARLYRDDKPVYLTKVVVGKPTTPTPVFSNRMQFLIVNPYWNVPLSIVKKEMMPKLAEEPDYFAKHGYQLVQHGHVTYVRQPPGDANALGRIKFMFPNEHSVYMHDTPSKSFFARTVRAFSHGCVRVDQPFRFAEAVLGHGWSEDKVRKLIGGQERTINLPETLPIHMMYFTTNVDENGKLQVRDDLYGYMKKVKLQLGLAG